jgi:predicted dehydrogenase
MSDTPLNVALVGYGLAGKVFHAPLITTTPGLRLAAVVSSRRDEIAADLPDAEPVDSLQAVLAPERGIDLVVIATPNDSHAPLAAQAIAAGRHVVVDKPFTVTVAEAEALRDQARRAGVLLSVFQNRRWTSDFLTVRRLIESGELGEIAQCEIRFDRFRPAPRDRWRERQGPGAGVWYDLGSHLIDQALQLFGPPQALWADLATQRDGADLVADWATDWFHAVLRYPRLRVLLHSGAIIAEPGPVFAVHGTQGSFVKLGLDPQEDQAKQGMKPGQPGWGVDPSPGVLTRIDADGRASRATPAASPGDYGRYYAQVRDAIWGRGPNPVPPEQALGVMRLIELGAESARSRRELPAPTGLLA